MNKPKLSIVLPCYNEAGNIPLIYERLRNILQDRVDVEVLMVNNGSTDQSQEAFERESANLDNSFARVVHVKVNQGYGFGIMSGVREAKGEVVAWTHADMQTDPKDVLDAHQKLLQHGDRKAILKGRRIARNSLDAFFTFGMSVISSFLLKARLFDINAQPKMFFQDVITELKEAPDDFSLDLYLLYWARKQGRTILEHKVSFADRQHGEAKGGGTMKGKIKLIKRTFAYILSLRRSLKEKGS
jgi:glycosyltransferase involved in cell wall biosynthesis